MLLCYLACATDSLQLGLRGLSDVSVNPARGCRAVGVASWMRAMTVGAHSFMGAAVPVLSLMSIRAVSTVCTAGYSGTAGSVAVALAAWVMPLYGGMLVDLL